MLWESPRSGRLAHLRHKWVGAAVVPGVKTSQYYSASFHLRRTVSTLYKAQGKSYSRDAAHISILDTVWAHPWQSGWSLPFMFSLPSRHPVRISHNPLDTVDVVTDVIIQKF